MESLHAKHAAIIYNPIARGLSRHPRSLQSSTEALARMGLATTLVATAGPGAAATQARSLIQGGCDLIIAAGGDGTINEVANGMLHSGVPLAILPGGTANVLAREIRLPRSMDRVAARIDELQPIRIPVGRLHTPAGPRVFLCMAGAGLDAEIVYRLNLDLKAVMGKLAYYVGGFGQVFRPLKEFEVTVDGHSHTASFALISRVRNYGGDLEIARGASLLRNEFEVVLFRGTIGMRYLPYLFGVVLRRMNQMKGCRVVRGSSVACASVPATDIYYQVDGELGGPLPVSAEIVPDALTLLVPREYLTREQALVAVPACA
ncbi:MAG TPA: diacylglycerol kinase family protein [Bryobacteraceae bacterium]